MKQIVDAVLEWQADERFAKATQLKPMVGGIHRGPREPKSVCQKLTMSVKQLKEGEGIEFTGEAWEDAPLNPSLQSIYLQQLQAQQQQAAQQQAAAAGGAPGQPGQPEGQPSDQPGADQGQAQDQQDAGQPVATDSGPEDAQRDRQQ